MLSGRVDFLPLFLREWSSAKNDGCQPVDGKEKRSPPRHRETHISSLICCAHFVTNLPTRSTGLYVTVTSNSENCVLWQGVATRFHAIHRNCCYHMARALPSHVLLLTSRARRPVQVGIDPRWRERTNKIIQQGGGRESFYVYHYLTSQKEERWTSYVAT